MTANARTFPADSPRRVRPYAFAKWFKTAPLAAQQLVSRSKQARCHLTRIARLMPGVGEEVDRLRFSFRAARWVAHGPRSEHEARLRRVVVWRRMAPEARRACLAWWRGLSAEERAAAPVAARPVLL